MASRVKRIALITTGVLSLAIGGVGVALPLLPTTPFVLVAAIAFAKSSDRLHDWLLRHRAFGPLIADWRSHGAISRRAKTASVLSMAAVLVVSLLLELPMSLIALQVLVLGACAIFIISRPVAPER